MEGYWYKEWAQGRRFVIKISPGQTIRGRLQDFARAAGVSNAVIVSAVGSVKNISYRGIKAGARLPITAPRMHRHQADGPLELLGLEGNLIVDEAGTVDSHLHILAGKSSGEVVGGHLFDAEVFATCEILLTEMLVEGIERHPSRSGGVPTIFIDKEGRS
jgi:predicted DNA-binding protein with PD1-like motif